MTRMYETLIGLAALAAAVGYVHGKWNTPEKTSDRLSREADEANKQMQTKADIKLTQQFNILKQQHPGLTVTQLADLFPATQQGEEAFNKAVNESPKYRRAGVARYT